MAFLLGLLLVAASAVFYWASRNLNGGVHWAEEACRQSALLCQQPYWLLLGGGVLIAFAIAQKAFKA